MPKELTPSDVREWFRNVATGEVHYTKILDGGIPPELYPKLRKMLSDLCDAKEPVIEACGRHDGHYRPIQALPEPINLCDAPSREDSQIILPFNLREYCFLYNQTATILTGSKSSGKTGFLYLTVKLNMNHLPTILLSNLEGGESQMKDRFIAMGVDLESAPPFLVYPAYENHHHFMTRPDTFYVIDYIDCPEDGEFYLIAGKISRIVKKLKTLGKSSAVIGLQKPPHRDLAFGGAGTLKDAALYLAMDKNKLKIVDCKVPAQEYSPNNMTWKFKYLDKGTRFEEISREYGEDSDNEK